MLFRSRLAELTDGEEQPQGQAILAFLENEIGLEAMRRKDTAEAVKHFRSAIDLDARAVPAYVNLGDVELELYNAYFEQFDEQVPIPDLFFAATRNSYTWPDVRPVTVALRAVEAPSRKVIQVVAPWRRYWTM